MAARLQQLLGKTKAAIEPAYNMARTEVVKQYEAQMAKNAEYVVKDQKAADKLLKQWFYTQMSRIPNTVSQCKTEAAEVQSRLKAYKELPTTELATYLAFGAEVYAWFCIGEIVGRGGSLTGYNI